MALNLSSLSPTKSINLSGLAPKKVYTSEDIPGSPKDEDLPKEKDASFGEMALGVGEAALSTVTGMGASLAGMAVGVASIPFGKDPEEVASSIAGAGTYQPRTEKGQEYSEEVGTVFRESGAIGAMPGMVPEVPGVGMAMGSLKAPRINLKGLGDATPHETPPKSTVEHPSMSGELSPEKQLAQTAFKDKTSGEILTSGPKHEELKKTETLPGNTLEEAEKKVEYFRNPPDTYHPKDAIEAKDWALKQLKTETDEDARTSLRILIDQTNEIIEGDQHPSLIQEHGITITRNKNYIDVVELPKDLQGKGLGSKIASNLEADMRKEGHKNAFLLATPDSVGFWEKQGYTKDPKAVEEKGENVLMSKSLRDKEPIPETPTSKYEQGFVTKSGEFLDRKEALALAHETGQLPKDHELEFPEQGLHSGDLRGQGHPNFQLEKSVDERNLELKAPETKEELGDSLYSLGKNKEADRSEVTQVLQQADKEGVDLPMKERWRDHIEEGKELDQREQELLNKYLDPIVKEIKELTQVIQAKGWVPPTELTEGFLGRKTIPKKMSIMEQVKAALTKGDQGGLDLNIEKKPGAAKERSLFVAQFPNGRRVVIQAEGGGKVSQWNKNKKTPFAQNIDEVKAGGTIGTATVREATQRELEAHSIYKYNKDTLAVSAEKLVDLRDYVRAKQLVENIKASPFFKDAAHKIDSKTPMPDGFKVPKYIDKVPEFAGYAFERNVANIIEDFAHYNEPNALTKISSLLIKNMMLNPLPHMANEGWHLYNARGLTGWITPAGIARFAKTGMPAVRSVMKQDPKFRSLLRDGASLLSADVRNKAVGEAFLEKGNREFIDSPEGRSLAESIGMAPLDLYNAISKKSSTAMWVVRDAMYTQLINEKMLKGLSQKEAIAEVERHMPSYRLPTEVMGSRKMSEVLQNPNVSVFSRYHYGMVKSLAETAKDLSGKRGKQAFLEGADTAAAIAVALAVLYPLQDMLAQYLTGNPDAKTRRAGPYHPIQAIADVMAGEKQPYSVLSSIFTFNPALLAGAQLIADRQLYSGQPVYNPTDDAGQIARDVGKYALTQVPQVSTTLQVSGEKGGGMNQWLAKQVDIQSPSESQTAMQKKMQHRALVASENRRRKREHAE